MPDPAPDLRVELTEDPAAFLAGATAYLARDPLLSTVLASVTQRAADADASGAPRPEHPRWWATVRSGEARGATRDVVGVAMRTAPFAPHPAYVLAMPDEAARALARALHARGEVVGGVNGDLAAATALARELVRLRGGAFRVEEHNRLFELGELVEPRPVPGRLRPATAADTRLALEWFRAFDDDAAEQAGRSPGAPALSALGEDAMAERIRAGRVFLWEDDGGEVVHLTGISPASLGVARIGPVYTPRERRGQGFASAAVAEVSRRLRATGARVCLFTDQANPTSNRVYQALGYVAVADTASVLVDGPRPVTSRRAPAHQG